MGTDLGRTRCLHARLPAPLLSPRVPSPQRCRARRAAVPVMAAPPRPSAGDASVEHARACPRGSQVSFLSQGQPRESRVALLLRPAPKEYGQRAVFLALTQVSINRFAVENWVCERSWWMRLCGVVSWLAQVGNLESTQIKISTA